MIEGNIAAFLLEEAHRINSKDFIADDPVQFPRRFEKLQDIEICALLVAAISWGKRSMILKNAERMLSLMDYEPYLYMMEKGYEDLSPDQNLHRTFFGRDFQWYLRGLRKIYSSHGSLNAFARKIKAGESHAPAWILAEAMLRIATDANNGETCPQCIPTNLETTALKRINMAMRWLVRDDGIVDLGVWDSIPKTKLFIPLDIHSGNTARELGLLHRKANDRKSVDIITEAARSILPDDPALLDFALFGIGVTAKRDLYKTDVNDNK